MGAGDARLLCILVLLGLAGCGYRTALLDASRDRGGQGGATPDAAPDLADADTPADLDAPADAAPDSGKTVLKLATYGGHSAALLSDGTVKCWGYNKGGQIGDGTDTDRWTPVVVPGLANATDLGAGGLCALLADGSTKCWSTAGGVLDGGMISPVSVPADVPDLAGVVEVSSSSSFSCARLEDHSTKCWGGNSYGRLGDGTTIPRSRPVLALGLSEAVQLSTSVDHSCAALRDGTAKCWGWGGTGCLGDGSADWTVPTPVTVRDLSTVVEVAVGTYHACARLADGTASCWGYNLQGELGDGSTVDHSTPVVVQDLAEAAQIVAGYEHTCARLEDGTVKCWGNNANGALGDGTTIDRHTPVAVPGLSDVTQLAVGSASSHSCALLGDGRVMCWGRNSYGQLGDGTTSDRSIPTEVQGLP